MDCSIILAKDNVEIRQTDESTREKLAGTKNDLRKMRLASKNLKSLMGVADRSVGVASSKKEVILGDICLVRCSKMSIM